MAILRIDDLRAGLTAAGGAQTIRVDGQNRNIEIYNVGSPGSADFEKVQLFWSASVATLLSTKGGTGASRTLRLQTFDGSGITFTDNGRASANGSAGSQWGLTHSGDGVGLFFNGRILTQTVPAVSLGNDTFGTPFSASSGTQKLVSITGARNQTGTAAFTALDVTITGTGGSGSQRLLSLTAGGSDRFFITDSGQIRISDKVKPLTANGTMTFEADHTSATTEAISFLNSGSLTAAAGTQTFVRMSADIGQSGTAAYKIFRVFAGEVSNGSGEKAIFTADVNTETKFAVMSGSAAGAFAAGVGGNIGLNTTSQFGGGKGVFGIANATTVPAANPTGGGVLYAEAGAGKWRGSGGTVTTFGPAEPHCPDCGRDCAHEWSNERDGWYLAVCMWCLTDRLGLAVGGVGDGLIAKRQN